MFFSGHCLSQTIHAGYESGQIRQQLVVVEKGKVSRDYIFVEALTQFSLSANITPKLFVTGVYYRNLVFIGYSVDDISGGASSIAAQNYLIGLGYAIKIYKKLEIQPILLLNMVNYQRTGKLGIYENSIVDGNTTQTLTAKTTDYPIGFRVQPYPKVKLNLKLMKRLHFGVNIAYNWGFKKMQEWNVEYTINGVSQTKARTYINGSTFNPSLSVALVFGKIRK